MVRGYCRVSYDALGRTTTITLPDGSVSSYSYSGNTTTVTDPAGKWKTYTTDAMGNLTQVTEPAPEGGTHLTTYAYNLFNKLTTVTMPRSTGTQTRTFNYDLTTAHLTSVTNPESGTVTFAYNPDGSMLSKTDAKGQKIQFTYDTYGRVTVKQNYKSGGTEDLCGKATNYWDTRPSGVGGTGWENVSGRLMAVRWSDSSCPGGQFTEGYQYDTGLPTIKRLYAPPLGSNSYIDASFTYTDQGQLQSMAYPVWHGSGTQWPAAGKTFTYSLDTLSRPIGLTDEAQTAWVSGVTYGGTNGPAGQMTAMTYGTGTQIYAETFAYNVRGQLTNLTATGNGLASVNLQYKFAAFPNNDGRLTQMEDAVSGEETNYMYDSLGRLTDAHTTGAQWGQTFSYDGFGNLTAETATKGPAPSVTRTYDPATNRLTGTGYAYDANGNLTAMPGLTMTYNVENRMTQAVNTNFNETDNYGYGPTGLRLWKQSMTDSIIHVYYNGLDGKPLADFYLSSGSVQGGTPMVYFAGKRVDNQSVEDRLGTAVVEGGTTRMAYYPYGELRNGTSTEVQFATYKRDSVTNLDYAHQRYYSTQIVRFLTPDPYRANNGGPGDSEGPQSWNRYSYAGNDPINHNDPSGEEWCSVGAGEKPETVFCEIVSFQAPFMETIADYDDFHGLPMPIDKTFNIDQRCHESAATLMNRVEANFAQFGNYAGSFDGLPTTLRFVVPPGGIAVGQTIQIQHTTVGITANDSVTVTQANATSFTFSTDPGHPLDATITFTASQQSSGFVGFSIDIEGQPSNGFWSVFFKAGGSAFEDDVWNHFLDDVAADCALRPRPKRGSGQ